MAEHEQRGCVCTKDTLEDARRALDSFGTMRNRRIAVTTTDRDREFEEWVTNHPGYLLTPYEHARAAWHAAAAKERERLRGLLDEAYNTLGVAQHATDLDTVRGGIMATRSRLADALKE